MTEYRAQIWRAASWLLVHPPPRFAGWHGVDLQQRLGGDPQPLMQPLRGFLAMDTTNPHDRPAVAPTTPAAQVPPEVLKQVLIGGDLSGLSSQQRADYYGAVCRALGLNPLTKPFEYLTLNGKLQLYALRDCADQLRRLHGSSIAIVNRDKLSDIYIVTARAKDVKGREDESTGAVPLGNLRGDALANALMKAETKAKRLAQTAFGFADGERRLRHDLGFEVDEQLTLMHLCAHVTTDQYQTLTEGYTALLTQEADADVP